MKCQSDLLNPSRQTHLDAIRGLAAFIVVLSHYFAAFCPYVLFSDAGHYQQHANWESILFYPPFGLIVSAHFAVCLFFILSGYVLSYHHLGKPCQKTKLLGMIAKRPIRLGGLMWFSMIIASLLWYFSLFHNGPASELSSSTPWFSGYWSDDFDLFKFLKDIFTSSFSAGHLYNPPLWTIEIELYGSLMVYLFILFFGSFKYRWLISLAMIVVFRDSLYQGFWIGILMADIIKNHPFEKPFELNRVAFFILSALFIYLSSYPNYVSQEFIGKTIYAFLPDDKGMDGGYPMLSALLIFFLVVTNGSLREWLNHPALRYLGHISYSMYVMHFLILASFSSWLFVLLNNHMSYSASFIITLFTGLPVILLVSHITTQYIDDPSITLSGVVGARVSRVLAFFGRSQTN